MDHLMFLFTHGICVSIHKEEVLFYLIYLFVEINRIAVSSILPLAILLFSTLHHLVNFITRGRIKVSIKWRKFTIFSVLVTTLFLSLNILISTSEQCRSLRIILTSIAVLTAVVKLFLMIIIIKTEQVTSRTILIFWLLQFFIYSVITIKESSYETTNDLKLIPQCINLALTLVLLIIQWFPYTNPDESNKNEENASFMSVLLFHWMDHLFIKGFRNKIEFKEIPQLPNFLNVHQVIKTFESNYKNTVPGLKNILLPLVKSFWSRLVIGTILRVFNDILLFLSPFILRKILKVMESDKSAEEGYFWCVILLASTIAQNIISCQYFRAMFTTGFQMRTVVMSTIFKKSLKLSSSARQQYTVGEITNLLAIDAQRIIEVMPQINVIWSAPFQIILSLYFLYDIVGNSAFAGMAVLFLLVPANLIGNYFGKRIQTNQMNLKDQRVLKLNEILQGIKVIKYYAWEKPFMSIINKVREYEIKTIRQNAFVISMLNVTYTIVPLTVTLTTFVVYITADPENHILTAEKVFSCIAIFNVLRVPLYLFPMFFMETVKLFISLRRISKFLECTEIENNYISENCRDNLSFEISNASFNWNEKSEEMPVLNNINLQASKGELIAVIGKVGSGKSSLLASIIGDMNCNKGELRFSNKSLSYVSQQAWIQNKTLKENILFGNIEKKEFYEKVLKACALSQDLNILSSGDATEIGENGVNLSGGQKQRVALARAAYRFSDVS